MTESEAPPRSESENRDVDDHIGERNCSALSGPWATVVHNSVNNLVQGLDCGISLQWHNWNVQHSVEQLNRGEEHVRLGLLEHELHDGGDVHNHLWPVFLYHPGLAVSLSGREPLRTSRAHHLHDQELECRRTARSVPLLSSTRGFARQQRQERNQGSQALPPTGLPAAVREQPFDRDVLGQDLGHFDNLLGIRHERVDETEDVWQLFHCLRHKSVEDLHHGSKAD